MPKSKKTRKQKLLADTRRKSIILDAPKTDEESRVQQSSGPKYVLNEASFKSNLSSNHKAQSRSQRNISTVDYQYLRSDLQKTIYLTGFILVAEIAVKFILKV